MSPLFKRTVWSALSSRQRRFALGNALARRFAPDISPFAATKDNSVEAKQALVDLLSPGRDHIYLLQADKIELPDELTARMTALGVLMVQASTQQYLAPEFEINRLNAADIDEMVELTNLTKPGPFTAKTPLIGRFWGVKLEDRLAAMAGTRLDFDGFTEVSGVCTHPDFRGRGLARLLSVYVSERIREAGDTPFLHAYASNEGAIALYKNLGFQLMSEVNVAMVGRRPIDASG